MTKRITFEPLKNRRIRCKCGSYEMEVVNRVCNDGCDYYDEEQIEEEYECKFSTCNDDGCFMFTCAKCGVDVENIFLWSD